MANHYVLNTSRYGTHKIISSLLDSHGSILDVGCNDGYLKKIFPEGSFFGVDYSADSAKKAIKNGYKKVIVSDLNLLNNLKTTQKFDTIIFGDVLEHLNFPEKVLSHFIKKNLKRGGSIIISLPNIAHFMVRINLLLGKFDRTDSGILDKTHLHFYTIKTSERLIKSCHLKIVSRHFSSNRFGLLIKIFPGLGGLLGHNLIYLCQKR